MWSSTSIKNWPDYPPTFVARPNMTKNKVNTPSKLLELRTIRPGRWWKVYLDGTAEGAKVSIHYFLHESGTVADAKIKLDHWSNT